MVPPSSIKVCFRPVVLSWLCLAFCGWKMEGRAKSFKLLPARSCFLSIVGSILPIMFTHQRSLNNVISCLLHCRCIWTLRGACEGCRSSTSCALFFCLASTGTAFFEVRTLLEGVFSYESSAAALNSVWQQMCKGRGIRHDFRNGRAATLRWHASIVA